MMKKTVMNLRGMTDFLILHKVHWWAYEFHWHTDYWWSKLLKLFGLFVRGVKASQQKEGERALKLFSNVLPKYFMNSYILWADW